MERCFSFRAKLNVFHKFMTKSKKRVVPFIQYRFQKSPALLRARLYRFFASQIFWMTSPSQRHIRSPAWLAISSTRAWLWRTVWMPVAMLVMQLTASTLTPR